MIQSFQTGVWIPPNLLEHHCLRTEYSSDAGSSSTPASGSTTPVVTDSESTVFGSVRGARSPRSKEGSPTSSVTLEEKLQALLQERPPVMSRNEQQLMFENEQTQKSKQFVKEASEQGQVKWEVYWKYLEAASILGVMAYLTGTVLQQVFTLCESTAEMSLPRFDTSSP